MKESWDEVGEPKLPPKSLSFTPSPVHMVVGLFLGVLSAVIHPGLIMLLPYIWLIPAAIGVTLWIFKGARSLATGFVAAAVAWLTLFLGFWLYVALG
jgi:hypothetical protein